MLAGIRTRLLETRHIAWQCAALIVYILHVQATLACAFKEGKKRKEQFTLFSDHNGSLLRRQPGAMCISPIYQHTLEA